jgi:hypothetical protein
MAITEADYMNEAELDKWTADNIQLFVPGSIYLPPFQISTMTGKSGIPDGFAFSLQEQEWFVIEAELLSHGVWPHIAEQIVRFIVALQNPDTRRKIRNKLFEHIIANSKTNEACRALNTSPERLLQQIELFVEGVDPQVIIFIDETNRDLEDMAQALSSDISIFRIKKFMVNGHAEYYSPDQAAPIISTQTEVYHGDEVNEFEVVNLLGGGKIETKGRIKLYELHDGSRVHIKRSKFYPRQDYYWYGIPPSVVDFCKQNRATHVVFVMGEEGLVKVPTDVVWSFLETTRTSKDKSGGVRHYHCLISPGPEPRLYYSDEVPSFDCTEYYQAF